MSAKIFQEMFKHKFATMIVLLLVVAGGYFAYKTVSKKGEGVRYVTATVEKGTLIVSVPGSGQVSASSQVDIKPKASGDVVYVGVKNGQEVKTGALIAQLDAKEAQKAVRDAQMNLESVRLSLQKLQQPADALSIMQAENSLAQAQESKIQSEEGLKKAYEEGFNDVANAFLTLPSIISGLNNMLFGNDFEKAQSNIDWYYNSANAYSQSSDSRIDLYYGDVKSSYTAARSAYDANFSDYKSTSRLSSEQAIESLILETYETNKDEFARRGRPVRYSIPAIKHQTKGKCFAGRAGEPGELFCARSV